MRRRVSSFCSGLSRKLVFKWLLLRSLFGRQEQVPRFWPVSPFVCGNMGAGSVGCPRIEAIPALSGLVCFATCSHHRLPRRFGLIVGTCHFDVPCLPGWTGLPAKTVVFFPGVFVFCFLFLCLDVPFRRCWACCVIRNPFVLKGVSQVS